jgi:hypothetical protein
MMRRGLLILLGAGLVTACGEDTSSREPAARASASAGTASPAIPAPAAHTTRPLSEADVIRRLQSAGLTCERLDKTWITPREVEQLPAKPVAVFSVRMRDGKGNAESMTLVGFGRVQDAQATDRMPLNGFAVRNWFFLGTIAEHFRRPIVSALS